MRTWSVRGRLAAWSLAGLLALPAVTLADQPASSDARAYLGIATRANEEGQPGVVVRDVSPDSPAARAGMRDGDRIVRVGDQDVRTFNDLRQVVTSHKPGDKLPVRVMRDGQEQTVTVTLGSEPEGELRQAAASERAGGAFLGVFTQPMNSAMRDRLGLKADRGALVTRVMPGSPAAKAGLAELDLITAVNDTAVNGPQDLRRAIENAGPGKEVTLKVARADKTMDVKAKLGQETAERGDGMMPEGPGGFGRFPERMMPMFPGQQQMTDLQRKVQDLEKRVKELEQSQGKNPK